MIQVECECGRVIKTSDENAGKKARCPECGEIVPIPATRKGVASKSASGKPAAKSAKRRPPEDEFDDGALDDELDDEADEDEDFGDEDESELRRTKSKKGAAKSSSRGKSSTSSKKSAKEKGDSDAPSKKKKKKKGNDADLNKKILIGTGVVFGVLVLGLVIFLVVRTPGGASAGKVQVPQNFVAFSSQNGEISCQAPKDWPVKTGGGSGGVPPHATFENDGVKISFRSSPSGASFQMMATAGGARDEAEIPDEEKPVSKVHEIQKRKFADEMSGYQEVGNPVMIKTAGFGEGRMSEFTASAGLLGKVYGYRVTLLGTNNQWNCVCQCSPSQWKDYQPIFRKIIESAGGS